MCVVFEHKRRKTPRRDDADDADDALVEKERAKMGKQSQHE